MIFQKDCQNQNLSQITNIFKPQELKMSLEKNEIVLFVNLVNQDFKNKNTTTKNN